MKAPFFAALFMLAGVLGLAAGNDTSNLQPNIIFILADDMGWGDLRSYGNPWIKTPNLDRLASKGILFTNAYAGSPVCSPTRAGTMTGCNPSEIGIHGHMDVAKRNAERGMPQWLPLPDKLPNIARFLQQHGYATAHFGKWHLGGPWQTDAPVPGQYGFDSFSTFVSNGPQLDEHSSQGKGKIPSTDFSKSIVDLSIDFIHRNRDRPFFINAWMHVAHAPLVPTKEMMAAYPEFAAFGTEHDAYREDYGVDGFSTPRQVYYSMITDMDAHIGRLLDELKTLGIENNTLVVFSSDNGPEIDQWPNSHHGAAGSTGPFRGVKRSLYEGGIRVPFIVSWPAGQVKRGTVDRTTIVSLTDLPATFAAAAGFAWQGGPSNSSENLLAAFQGKPISRNSPLFWSYREGAAGHPINFSPLGAIREGEWKLLANPDKSRIELYNLTKDFGETDNVADQYPEITDHLFARLSGWLKDLPSQEFVPKELWSSRHPYWSGLLP